MRIQSQGGVLRLLPALPGEWQWKHGKATGATLACAWSHPQRLEAPQGQRISAISTVGHQLSFRRESDDTGSFDARAGRTYHVIFE